MVVREGFQAHEALAPRVDVDGLASCDPSGRMDIRDLEAALVVQDSLDERELHILGQGSSNSEHDQDIAGYHPADQFFVWSSHSTPLRRQNVAVRMALTGELADARPQA